MRLSTLQCAIFLPILYFLGPEFQARQPVADPTMSRQESEMIVSIGGTVTQFGGLPAQSFQVELSGDATGSQTTNASGQYLFSGLANGGNYSVAPLSPGTICTSSCLDVYDLYLIQRHILGITPLVNPYAMLAADVNYSNTITTQDIILLRQLILGNTTAFANAPCWRFVDAAFVFPNPANPFAGSVPETISFNNLNANVQANFIAIRTGDVSGCTEALAASALSLSADFNADVCPDDHISVPVVVQNFSGISALQFSMRWNPAVLTYEGVLNFGLPGLSNANFGLTLSNTDNGLLTMTWVESNGSGLALPDGTVIVHVLFNVIGTPGEASSIGFSDTPLAALAVDGQGLVGTVQTTGGFANVNGAPVVIGPAYCVDGNQFISFYAEGQVSGADGENVFQAVGNNGYWMYNLPDDQFWLIQVDDNGPPPCSQYQSGTAGSCMDALIPDCDDPLQLTNNNGDDDQAVVWGNYMAWQGFDGTDYEIYLLNLNDPAAAPVAVTNNTVNDWRPALSSNSIVWEQETASDREVLSLSLYDLGATPLNLSNDPVNNDALPRIGNNYVVWHKNNDLYYYDIGTSSAGYLATTGSSSSRFDLSGHTVVWEALNGGDLDIFAADLSNPGAIQTLSNNAYEDSQPKIAGRYVAWVAYPGAQGDIYAYELGVSASAQLLSPASGFDNALDLYGQYAVWAGQDGSDYEIYSFDLSQLGSASAQALTNNSTDDFSPSIWGNHVVWNTTDGDNLYLPLDMPGQTPFNMTQNVAAFAEPPQVYGHLAFWRSSDTEPELFMYDLTLVPPPAPVLDNMLSQTTNLCPGDQATLVLQTGGNSLLEPQWFADDQMATLLYSDIANQFQPTLNNATTYYAAWRNSFTGCLGPLTPVSLAPAATDNLICNDQLTVALNDQCTAAINADQVLEGTFGCLNSADFVVNVNDGNPGNGAIADGAGTYDCTISLATGIVGNFTSCTMSVTAIDNLPPSLVCPPDQNAQTPAGEMSAAASWPDPVSLDNCTASLSSSHVSGSQFPVGQTQVTYTATDNGGNTSACQFTVNVTQTLAAVVFNLPTVNTETGQVVCLPLTVENFGGVAAVQFSIAFDPSLVQFSGLANLAPLSGLDNTDFGFPGSSVITFSWIDPDGSGESLPNGATLFEVCFEALTPGTADILFSGTPTPIEVVDGAGTILQTEVNSGAIIIQAPFVLVCPGDIVQVNDPGLCSANVNVPTILLPEPGTLTNDFNGTGLASGIYPVGTTVVTYTFTSDMTGLSSSCTLTVTVSDIEPPMLQCPPNISVTAMAGQTEAVVNFGNFQLSDNCGETILDCSHLTGSLFPCGITTVNCFATDTSGNISTPCSFFANVDCLQLTEACNNGMDDDGDGLIDAFDPDCPCDPAIYGAQCDPECEYTFSGLPWQIEDKWASAEDIAVYQTPMVGDIDNDGTPEVVILSTNSYNSNPRTMRDLRVLNGQTGTQELLIPTVDGLGNAYDVFWDEFNVVAIANVDADPEAELFVASAETAGNDLTNNSSYLFCYEHDGTFKWKSSVQYGYASFPGRFGSAIGLADFNADGIAEVYVYDQIFNAQTGVLLASGNNTNGIARSGYNNQSNVATRAHPVAANLTDSPGLELACGRTVYEVTITNTTGTTGNNMTAINAPPVAFGLNTPDLKDGFTSFADINLDGGLDVVVSWVDPSAASSQQALVYVWDPRTATVLAKADLEADSSVQSSIGVAFVGDMDNDCEPEIGICRPNTLFALEYDGTGTLTQKWSLGTTDGSGLTGLTLFDFNQDGVAEIVYRDQDNLRIIDGSTSTPANLTFITCYSSTGGEMPVVADVDGDGFADICLTCANNPTPGADRGKVRAFSSGSQPWAPTRPVWNQNAYHVFNINDDLTVPITPNDNAVVLSVADCNDVCNKPYNNFLQQATYLTQEGCPTFPAPDATVTLLSVERICPEELVIQFFVDNISADAPLPAGLPVSFYIGNPLLPGAIWLGTTVLPDPISPLSSSPIGTISFAGVPAGPFDLFVAVNDDHSQTPPIVFPITNIPECDYTNNLDTAPVEDCNCLGLSITPTPVDSAGYCCWMLNYENTGTDDVYGVEIIALDGVTIDFTEATGYLTPNQTDTSVLVTPSPFGSTMPAQVDGLLDICLGHVLATPQYVVVNYYDENFEVFCSDTLRFQCPIERTCLYIVADSLVCDSNGYKYTAVVANPPGGFDVGFIKFNITNPDSSVTFNPSPTSFVLTDTLQPGEQTTLMFTINTSADLFGDSLCFVLSAHDGVEERLCCAEIDTCIAFPQCDPCPYLSAELQAADSLQANECCFSLYYTDTLATPGLVTGLTVGILNPGINFSGIEALEALLNGWSHSPAMPANSITWTHNSGSVPTGVNNYLFDFCVEGLTTTDSIYIEINWLGTDLDTICTDTLALYCPSCLAVVNDSIVCKTAPDGSIDYQYNFQVTNYSSFLVNTIAIVEIPSSATEISPNVISITPLQPYDPGPPAMAETSAPISFVIDGAYTGGDTVCFDLVLRQVVSDSIDITCCYVRHCIVLPPCDTFPPCADILCVPPPDASIECANLPPDFDPLNTAQLQALFGVPSISGDCPGASWQELSPQPNLADCIGGTIVRNFVAIDGAGNASTNICQQIVTITPGPPAYTIRFPADVTLDCEEFAALSLEIGGAACDLLAVSFTDEVLTSLAGECFKLRRHWQVINWCEYDGTSAPVLVTRNEDCDGQQGEEDVWVLVRPGGVVYFDQDNDENNGIPAAGIRNTGCDGLTNPAGHWVNSLIKPAINSIGYWEYFQVVTIIDNTPPNITVASSTDFCINNNTNCTGPVAIPFTVSEVCPIAPPVVRAWIDLASDATLDLGVQLESSGTLTTLAGLPGAITIIDLGGGNYTANAINIPLGNHTLVLEVVDPCGAIQTINFNFSMTDCLPPSIVCINGLAGNIVGLVDTDGDGDPDEPGIILTPDLFLDSPSLDCSPPVTYSINIAGQPVSQSQTSIAVTCADLGLVNLEIHAWDAAGNQDFCQTFFILQDPSGLCPAPPPGLENEAPILLFPNPATNEVWIWLPAGNWVDMDLLSPIGERLEHRNPGQQQLQRINTERLSAGLYFVRLRNETGLIRQAAFVRQRPN